ncbi:1,25-dihydroxyvitamin D(3) 24-hydroxylase, mitochondrial [Plakobranchus ocellatus]|uniref:Cholesterol side-chain cleavage enzyme, mitochondrial n=1 Tax=Plakobranchus ocellatus TaxID=259542 RepID=A0AAV4A7S8_9GAST|nr:1,25-dihydroxyvitamin D(3) 24-hydroxylase, mitochondrial [Plakobranchus ocellatus]
MGDIALRRVLSHVTKVLTCSRPPTVAASPPCQQTITPQAASASTAAAPSPMATSSDPAATSSTSVQDMARRSRGDGDGLGYTIQSSTPTLLSEPNVTQSSSQMFTSSDSSASPQEATQNSLDTPSFYGGMNTKHLPSNRQSATVASCPFASSRSNAEPSGGAATTTLNSTTSATVASPTISPGSESTNSNTLSTDVNHIRPFSDLPCPPGWPILGSFIDYFKRENRGQMHELMRRRHRQFGKIFREQFGPRQNVIIADPGLMAEVLRKEGKYPSRPPYESWVLYNQSRKRDGGLMTSEREYWKKSRGVLAAKLRPRAVAEYVPIMNEVCSDFLSRIAMLKVPDSSTTTGANSHSPQGVSNVGGSDHTEAPNTVPRMVNELNKFTMETILYVMLNKRIGCLDPKPSEEVDSFIRSIATMFLTGHQLMVYANIHKLLSTRPWREHVQSWDKIYAFGESGSSQSNRIK